MNEDAKIKTKGELKHYLSLNYHKRLYQDEDGSWIVEVDDLPGCIADGKSPDEAISNLAEAMTSWLRSRLDAGLPVPEPAESEEYSGKALLRMPKFLHRRLSLQAQAEGSSLNQYLVSLLSDASARVRTARQMNVALTEGAIPAVPLAGLGTMYVCAYGTRQPLGGWRGLDQFWTEGIPPTTTPLPLSRSLFGQPEPRQPLLLESRKENSA